MRQRLPVSADRDRFVTWADAEGSRGAGARLLTNRQKKKALGKTAGQGLDAPGALLICRSVCTGHGSDGRLLWPLWDRRRQTFADKLTGTFVVGQAPPSSSACPAPTTACT